MEYTTNDFENFCNYIIRFSTSIRTIGRCTCVLERPELQDTYLLVSIPLSNIIFISNLFADILITDLNDQLLIAS